MKNKQIILGMLLAVGAIFLGCTGAQGKLDADILTGACDAGSILLSAPGLMPLCADISLVEQLIANWKTTQASGAMKLGGMSETDLYQMAKASGKTTPARGVK